MPRFASQLEARACPCLEAYARRREADRDAQKITTELPRLVDGGIAAGMSAEEVTALALGGTEGGESRCRAV